MIETLKAEAERIIQHATGIAIPVSVRDDGDREIERVVLEPDGVTKRTYTSTAHVYTVAFSTGFNGQYITPRYPVDGIEFAAAWARISVMEADTPMAVLSQIAHIAKQFAIRNAAPITAWKAAQKKGKRK